MFAIESFNVDKLYKGSNKKALDEKKQNQKAKAPRNPQISTQT